MSIDIKETVYWTESPQDGFNMANGKRVDRPSSAYVLGVRTIGLASGFHSYKVGDITDNGETVWKITSSSWNPLDTIHVFKRLTDELVPFSNVDNYLREVIDDDDDDATS